MAVKRISQFLRNFVLMGGTSMVSREQALPGRATKMPISKTHYVLKNPMEGPWPPGSQVVVLANGCFWGSEKGFWRLPGNGIVSTAVGYAAGFTPNPTYEEVCSGRTGHTEAVQVVYDPARISLVDIMRWFWESHDPTQLNKQGNDVGTQYRSGAYYFDDEQRAIIEASKAAYEKAMVAKGYGKVATQIAAAADYEHIFYYAEDYHQQYLAKPGARPYCSAQPRQVPLPPYETWEPFGEKVCAQSDRGTRGRAIWRAPRLVPSALRTRRAGAPLSQPRRPRLARGAEVRAAREAQAQASRGLLGRARAHAALRDPRAARADQVGAVSEPLSRTGECLPRAECTPVSRLRCTRPGSGCGRTQGGGLAALITARPW